MKKIIYVLIAFCVESSALSIKPKHQIGLTNQVQKVIQNSEPKQVKELAELYKMYKDFKQGNYEGLFLDLPGVKENPIIQEVLKNPNTQAILKSILQYNK